MNANTITQAAPSIPHRLPVLASLLDQITIKGSKEKRRILDAYDDEFGSNNPDSIITRKKVSRITLCLWIIRHETLSWQILLGGGIDTTQHDDISPQIWHLHKPRTTPHLFVNTEFPRMIPKLLHWSKVNFHRCKSQNTITKTRKILTHTKS